MIFQFLKWVSQLSILKWVFQFPNYQISFYLEDLSQIQWSISQKQNNGRAYETKIGDKEHHFDYCFEFDTIRKW